MSTIFVSHSSLDRRAAEEIRRQLDGMGHESVFLDSDATDGIPAGQEWEHTLYRKLKACRAVVVIHSANWLTSRWCFVEVAYARALGKHIFPLLIDNEPIDGLLADRQAIDLTRDPEDGYGRLEKGLVDAGLDPEGSFRWEGGSPYPGLDAFDEDHAAVFFGREEEIGNGLDPLKRIKRLGTTGLMMILGPSGSGKSSLVRAGLIPRLRRDERNWIIVDPFRPLDDPTRELSAALARAFQDRGDSRSWHTIFERVRTAMNDVVDPPNSGNGVSADAHGSPPVFRGRNNPIVDLANELRLAAASPDARVVITIDQFEELLNRSHSAQWTRLLALLRDATEREFSPVLLLGTMRSDFLETFQRNPALTGLEYIALFIGPMSAGHIAQVIQRPAELSGIEIRDDLVQEMIADATSTDNALPLLAFTLRELHDRYGDDDLLELSEYRTQLGGLEGAIARTAEGIVDSAHLSESGLGDLRSAFLAMVRLADEGKYTKRVAGVDQISAGIRPTLDKFEEARLLVIGMVEGRAATYEVRHDALFRSWDRLATWIDENVDDLRLRRDLAAAAVQWHDGGNTPDRLWSDARVARAQELIEADRLPLDEDTKTFVESSARAITETRRAREKRRNLLLGTSVVVAAVMTVLALVSVSARRAADQSALLARSRAIAARAIETVDERPDLALLLGLEALHLADTREARDAVLTLQRSSPATDYLRTHSTTVEQVDWDHTSNAVASIDSSGHISLWDVDAGEQVFTYDSGIPSSAIAIGANGSRLAAGTDEGVLVWRSLSSGLHGLHDAEPIAIPHSNPVTALDIDQTGQLVATAASDFEVRLFDAATGGQRDHPKFRHRDRIWQVAFSTDGRSLVTASEDGEARIWDIESGTAQVLPHDTAVRAASFSPDGSLVATGADDFLVRLWNVGSADEPATLGGHTSRVRSVAFDAEGAELASAGDDQSVIEWNVAGRFPTRKLVGHSGLVRSVVFGPRSEIASGGLDRTVILWAPDATPRPTLTQHDLSVRGLVFNRAGNRLTSVGEGGRLIVWDPTTGSVENQFEGTHEIQAITISPDGRVLATAGDDPVVRLWNAETLAPIGEHPGHAERVWSVAYSLDGATIASSGDDGSVILTDLSSGEQTTLHEGNRSIRTVAFGGPTLLAWGSDDGTVTVWDLEAREVRHVLTDHRREVWSVAFSGDAKWLAAAGNDDVVMIWNTESGNLVAELSGATQDLRDINFDPTTSAVAAVGQDGSILVWEVGTWRLLNRIDGQTGRLWTVAYHPTRNVIAAAGVDRTVVLWEMDLAKAVANACQVAGRNLTLSEWELFTNTGSYVRHCAEYPAGADAPTNAPAAGYAALQP